MLQRCHPKIFSPERNSDENDNGEKTEQPIHVIIGTSKYAQIKTKQNIRIENRGEQVAKYPAFEWTIISGGYNHTQLKTICC